MYQLKQRNKKFALLYKMSNLTGEQLQTILVELHSFMKEALNNTMISIILGTANFIILMLLGFAVVISKLRKKNNFY